MRVTGGIVPKNRMRQFHEILCATGSRYTSTPQDCGDVFRVDYIYGDYEAHNEAWRLITSDVKEVRKDQWFRCLLRRVVSTTRNLLSL